MLQNYFGYDIFYVMNITDIDDKIIKRARQNHLYENYVSKNHPLDKILADCNDVMIHFKGVVEKTADLDKRAMHERLFISLNEAVKAVAEAIESKSPENIESGTVRLLEEAKDLLSDWLDKHFGAEVTENSIFSKLPDFWEEKFHEDMEALNVRLDMTFIFQHFENILMLPKRLGVECAMQSSLTFEIVILWS